MDLVTHDIDADGIVTLTLNDPDTRNAISDLPMIDAILEALHRANTDPASRVIVLTGTGKAFSSGGNIKKMGAAGGLNDPLPARTRLSYRNGIQKLPLAMEAMEIPVVAAVNGPAIGAGCDLTCMCDIRIASESAIFAESFVRLGIVPGDGGAWLLPRIVGFSKASEMALTGDTVDAAEALKIGLVSRVVADTDLMDAAFKIARKIAAHPTHAVRMTRRLLRESCNQSLNSVLELSAAFQALAHATADHEEAVQAFVSRRPPEFTGL